MACYRIHVHNPHGVQHGVTQTKLDGALVDGGLIPLVADGQTHEVEIELG